MKKRLLNIMFMLFFSLWLIGCGVDYEEEEVQPEQLVEIKTDEMEENVSAEQTEEESADENLESEETNLNEEVTGELEVHFINVGQADAALVKCEGRYMLIDGGNKEDSSLIYAYLKEQGAEHLDYVVCSHAHEDHSGGLAGALNYASVGTVYAPVKEYDTDAYRDFVKYVEKQGKDITVPSAGEEFRLGNADCKILAVNTVPDDCNNTSIVMKVTYGESSFLFTGDAETVVEKSILNAGYDVKSSVLKVPHHGSDTSMGYQFLREVMPEYAIISVGEENSYGHPNEGALSKLRDAEAKAYRTDLQGHIIAKSDGKNVTITVQKNEGADTLKGAGAGSKNEAQTENTKGYVLNTNTKKFHYPSCKSVSQMSEKNKGISEESRETLIGSGYSSCGNCKP